MADFLLVHGSCHGAWCWRDLIPELKALGHTARAIDLPGNGEDDTPCGDATLPGCGAAVLAASTPDTIILGHSWGGFPIAAAAEVDPKAMRALIFLCAYVPRDGLSMVDLRKRAKRQPILPAVIRNPDGATMRIDPEQAAGLFYSDCSQEIIDFAVPLLCDQAILPQKTPLEVSQDYESVEKFYIRCTEDQTIPPEYQAEMVDDWPSDRVFEMPTSHSPFFSDPKGLAKLMDQIARSL
ncbi:alpha/beta fold hydrolase [Sulfitobacter sp. BDSS02]|nr:alpha/beta fold hydrolase [Sulfitobacter sp. BDSS02]MBR9848066.1 alpha/beta fold hydrolase [Paracoccaceae bacterium]